MPEENWSGTLGVGPIPASEGMSPGVRDRIPVVHYAQQRVVLGPAPSAPLTRHFPFDVQDLSLEMFCAQDIDGVTQWQFDGALAAVLRRESSAVAFGGCRSPTTQQVKNREDRCLG